MVLNHGLTRCIHIVGVAVDIDGRSNGLLPMYLGVKIADVDEKGGDGRGDGMLGRKRVGRNGIGRMIDYTQQQLNTTGPIMLNGPINVRAKRHETIKWAECHAFYIPRHVEAQK
jgi:hypothetical protein